MKFLIPFLIAFLGSKLIFRLFEMNHSLFLDPFNWMEFLINLGGFTALWILGVLIFNVFIGDKK